MFKIKKIFSSVLIHQIEIYFVFLESAHFKPTKHRIKPKVGIRDQKCKCPP